MSLLPEINQASAEINKFVAQANIHQTIAPVNPAEFTSPADTLLLASRDPVIREVSVGMTGVEAASYTVSGTPPLSLPNSLGKPLKAWSVDVLPYQEGTGDPSPSNVRPIHGTDKLTIYTDSKYGGLMEWNQQYNKDGNMTTNGIVFTNTNGYVSISGVALSDAYYPLILSPNIPANHVVVFGNCPDGGSATTYDITYVTNGGENKRTYSGYNIVKVNAVGTMLNIDVRPNYDADTHPVVFIPQIFDLTQMFGATKADEIYAMEQAEAGAGVAYFRSLFPLDYYPYNAGQQMTVDQVNGAQYSPSVLTLPQTVYTGTIGSEGGESRSGKIKLSDIGASQWDYYSTLATGIFRAPLSGVAIPPDNLTPTTAISTALKAKAWSPLESTDYACFGVSVTGLIVVTTGRTISTVSDFLDQWGDIEVCYPLATPVQFPLTTPTIPTPSGTATTWATAEDGTVESMEVTYIKSE